MPVYHNLKKLREKRNLTQQELAEKLNISQNAYSALETGKTKIDEYRIHQLAKILKVPFTDLMIDDKFVTLSEDNINNDISGVANIRNQYMEAKELIDLLKNELAIKNTQIIMLHQLLERR